MQSAQEGRKPGGPAPAPLTHLRPTASWPLTSIIEYYYMWKTTDRYGSR